MYMYESGGCMKYATLLMSTPFNSDVQGWTIYSVSHMV